jgi:ribosomal protein L37E
LATNTLSRGKTNREITVQDRCDACGSQAYVWVNGVTGDLLFCGHHYTKIMNSEQGRTSMNSFAFETVDNRSKMSDKRAGL